MTAAAAILGDLDRERAERWKPRPAPRSHIAFARTLRTPDTQDVRGDCQPYDPASHPAQHHALAVLDGAHAGPRTWTEFLWLADTQDGKSWLLQQATFHAIIEKGETFVYALPTRDLALDIYESKLKPAAHDAGLGPYWPLVGPGSKGGATQRPIRFQTIAGRGGGSLMFRAAGGRGESGQAALTTRNLGIDELDDWNARAFNKLRRRVDRFVSSGQARVFMATTVKTRRDGSRSLGLREYLQSCRAVVHYRCPHCHQLGPMTWKGFGYDPQSREVTDDKGAVQTIHGAAPGSARLACTCCGVKWTDADRRLALADHALHIERPEARTFGLRWTALECPWKSLDWLADLHAAARYAQLAGDPEPMRTFVQDQQVEEWQDTDAEAGDTWTMTAAALADRYAIHGWADAIDDRDPSGLWSRRIAPVPEGAVGAVVAVDVQKDRIYWVLIAYALDGRTWDLAWGYEQATAPIEPFRPGQLSAVLDRLDRDLPEMLGGLPLAAAVVDTGWEDERTEVASELSELAAWLQANGPRWQGVRGVDDLPAKASTTRGVRGLIAWERSWRPGIGRWLVRSQQARGRVHAAYRRTPGTPGSAILPRNLRAADHYLRHLCAIVLVQDPRSLRWAWKQRSARHDHLDCRGYATATIARILQPDRAEVPDTPTDAAQPPPPPPDAGDWIGGSGGGGSWGSW